MLHWVILVIIVHTHSPGKLLKRCLESWKVLECSHFVLIKLLKTVLVFFYEPWTKHDVCFKSYLLLSIFIVVSAHYTLLQKWRLQLYYGRWCNEYESFLKKRLYLVILKVYHYIQYMYVLILETKKLFVCSGKSFGAMGERK